MKKKLLVFMILLFISPMFSCDEEKANKNDTNLTNLLFLLGNKTLTVNVTYTGTTVGGSSTLYIYAYLYNVRPTYTRSPVCVYSGRTSGPVNDSTQQTITISGIWSGDYYLMVFYDYKSGDNADNKGDFYTLYNGTTGGTVCIAQATTVNIPSVSSVDISFNSTGTAFPSGAGTGAGATFIACP
jgi:hypothetical protein